MRRHSCWGWFLLMLCVGVSPSVERTAEQKLEVLRFSPQASVRMALLREVADPAAPTKRILQEVDPRAVGGEVATRALTWVGDPRSYQFMRSAACFEPGLRISVTDGDRTVVCDVCLDCYKMEVRLTAEDRFMIDLTDLGLALYKSIYLDFRHPEIAMPERFRGAAAK